MSPNNGKARPTPIARVLRTRFLSHSWKTNIASKYAKATILLAKFARMAFLALGGALLFSLVFFLIHLPHGPEHWSADWRTLWFSRQPDKQDSRITLIEITDETLKPPYYLSPIDRHLLAKLIQAVDAAGPKAIGLDVIFDRATESSKDAELQQAIEHAHAPIVLGALDDDTLTESARNIQDQFLAKSQLIGHLYLGEERGAPVVISDHVIRKIAKPSVKPVNRLSFAEVLAGLDGVHDKVDEGRRIAWLLPPWEENDWLLWFAPKGEIDPFLTLPADLLLERDQDGSLGKRLLHDRFVLIGGNFPDRDQHFTPLSVWSEKRFSGLFIQAQILAQLLDNEHLYELNWQTYIVLVVAVGVLGVWIGRRDRVSHSDLWIELVIVITLILVSVVAFKFGKFIFPFVSVLVGLLAGMAGGHVIKSVPQDGHAAGGS